MWGIAGRFSGESPTSERGKNFGSISFKAGKNQGRLGQSPRTNPHQGVSSRSVHDVLAQKPVHDVLALIT